MADVYSGVIGLLLVVTFVDEAGDPIDLTLADEVWVLFKTPAGTKRYDNTTPTWSVAANVAQVRTPSGDVPSKGTYQVQGWVKTNTGTYPGAVTELPVLKSLTYTAP